ncbi:hypothetical protein [Parasphingorhabdus pacifica]
MVAHHRPRTAARRVEFSRADLLRRDVLRLTSDDREQLWVAKPLGPHRSEKGPRHGLSLGGSAMARLMSNNKFTVLSALIMGWIGTLFVIIANQV